MLKIDQLSKHFKSKKVLEEVSLHIRHGEIVSILGRSGSGKSTLLNLIAGFEHPDGGEIVLEGELLNGAGRFKDPSERSIGFVFQNYALFPHLTVAENIAFGISHLCRSERGERIEKMLRLIGLGGYEAKYPDTLSGGEQQRVALARVLATEPSVILLDEPFSNVDTVLKTSIRNELMEILRKSEVTALFVTHDPHEAMAISDRIAYIEGGKIIQFDTPEAIYSTPADESVAAFFGPINRYESGFVRVEQCRITEEEGIEAETVSSVFVGSRYETTVRFTQWANEYRFLLHTQRRYETGEKVMIAF